ncbi:MAG: preprotein translocase subunit SecY [Chloroflexi bacterium]|nr:preprotein translocase subunit SecY [Chloroflexota bacterium]
MRQREARPRPIQALVDAFSLPDLRGRLIFTFAILVVFRFVAHVPVPGVDLEALRQFFDRSALLGMLDLFSGGALRNFSVAAMGVYPYITASIVMQLLVPVIPKLQAMAQEGESGRQKVNQITHWLTVPLAALQGYAQLTLFRSEGVVLSTGALGTVATVMTMTAGTMFLVWLGELITERGIGNGISIIIFGNIVAGFLDLIGRGFVARQNLGGLVVFVIIAVLLTALIVAFTEAHRRIPVQYARAQMRGTRMYRQTGTTHIPLRVNMAGMIPLIFAMSILLFPGQIASWFAAPTGAEPNFANTVRDLFDTTRPLYWVLYFLLVVGFTFFYTMIIFQQQNLAKVLQQQGGFVPGIRPGQSTADYLNRVITRLTVGGALFLAFVAIVPYLAQQITSINVLQLSSTGLLIMVGVALDTMKQIEAQLLMRRYEGFLR